MRALESRGTSASSVAWLPVTTQSLPSTVLEVADGFWNIRGSFKIAGVVDIGTHASLVRRKNGRFVLLDVCEFPAETREWLLARTRGGDDVEAVLHLHPFHTLHVESGHALFPRATHHGTTRHAERAPSVPFDPLRTDDPRLHERFADDFDFMVPRGVDFIPSDAKLHFSSVLAFHPASKTLHVDDTLLHLRLPPPLSFFKQPITRFHPTLGKVLQRRPGAVAEFRAWAKELIDRASGIENLCAAHSSSLLHRDNQGESVARRMQDALAKVKGTLEAHERVHR
jgi:hypothetical protein